MKEKLRKFLGEEVFQKFEKNKIYKDGDYNFKASFVWEDSPEGHKYWSDLCEKFKKCFTPESIHKRMMNRFGAQNQVLKTVEECSEMIQSLIKHRLYHGSINNVVDEYHDILFTLGYVKEFFYITEEATKIAMKKREAHCEELLNEK